ncbi:MAG: hypothetical protein CMP67_03770 [Flavobacteriales bacterium]|nr:hypothetical protein [Flavobacteriales bacterium]|tara:strand:+ start:81 stop:1304 length:1224 start_codon:yes stop_codon:yes gene_type:complete
MKPIAFLFSIFCFFSCSQNNKNYESFGGSKFDECYDLDITPEGDIILTGIFSDNFIYRNEILLESKGSYDIFILKITSEGDIIWAKSIGGKEKDWVYNSTLDQNGNIYSCGFNNTKKYKTPFVSKLDKNGKLLWKKEFDSKGELINLDATNQEILVTGKTPDKSIYKISFDGDLIDHQNSENFTGRGIIRIDKETLVYGSKNEDAVVLFLNREFKKTKEMSFGTKGGDIILSCVEDKGFIHFCGQIEGDTLFWKNKNRTQKIPLKSKGGKDGFYAILDSSLNIIHFEIQTSPKNDWSRYIALTKKGDILMSTVLNQHGLINDIPIKNQKGNYDIALSAIKNHSIISTKLISSDKEEGINKIVVVDSVLYFAGWHQGTLKFTENIHLEDNEKGNGFFVRINKNKLFKN